MYEVVLAPLPGMSVQSGSQALSDVTRWRYWYRVMLESSGLSQRSVTCALPASARKFSRKGLLTVPLTLIISATRVSAVKGPVEVETTEFVSFSNAPAWGGSCVFGDSRRCATYPRRSQP